MVVAVWEGQASSGGLSVSETELLLMAVMQDGAAARRGHAAATLTRGRSNIPKAAAAQ